MSDFFSNLLDRSLSRAPVLQRRRPSLFEPAPQGYEVGGAVGRSSAVLESESVAEPQPPLRAGKFAPASLPSEMSSPEPRTFLREREDSDSHSARVEHPPAAARTAEIFPATHGALDESAKSVSGTGRQDHRGNEPRPQILPVTVVATTGDAPAELKLLQRRRDGSETINEGPRQDIIHVENPASAVLANRREPGHRLHEDSEPVRNEPRRDNNSDGKPVVAVLATRREHDPHAQTPLVAKNAKIDSAAPQREASHKPHVEPESIRPGKKNPVVSAVSTLAPRSVPSHQKSQSAPQQHAAPPPQPTIQVTIGRIEVRAAPVPAASARPARPAAAKLSLEDYLRSRSGGRS